MDKKIDFCNFANQWTSFLLKDKYIRSVLGSIFRRKFSTVWCTLGYYNKKDRFKIGSDLTNIFKQYWNLDGDGFTFHISELLLSRFVVLNIPEYTLEEFKSIAISRLKEENLSESTSIMIDEQVWNELRSKDIRDAIKVARLCGSAEVSSVIRSLKRYNKKT